MRGRYVAIFHREQVQPTPCRGGGGGRGGVVDGRSVGGKTFPKNAISRERLERKKKKKTINIATNIRVLLSGGVAVRGRGRRGRKKPPAFIRGKNKLPSKTRVPCRLTALNILL